MTEHEIFHEPTGTVRGWVTGYALLAEEKTRIVHAVLTTDQAPEVTVDIRARVSIEDVIGIAEALSSFSALVDELDRPRVR